MTPLFTRRLALSLGTASLLVGRTALAKSADWVTVSADEAGFPSDLNACFDAAVTAGKLTNLHGVVALHRGRIFFERYIAGADFAGGEPLGTIAFGPETLHDMRSVTKSVVGLLYGIALGQKKVPAPDQPLLASFPEYADLARDPARLRLTVASALTMTLGVQWHEGGLPYTSSANGEIAMNEAPDRYRYILEQPIVAPPGELWNYSGGAAALVGKLIEKGTGQSLPAFAEAVLFAPLGIEGAEWRRNRNGEINSASGVRLTPRDLARIGQMVLQGGRWNDRPVVPTAWLDSSFTPAGMVFPGEDYGYLWRVGEMGTRTANGNRRHRYRLAWGNGGQCLAIFPDSELVVAIVSGAYDDPSQRRGPDTLLREVLLANLSV